MKVAIRVVSLTKRENSVPEWVIHSIYESTAHEIPHGLRQDQVFKRKDGKLNAAADTLVQFGLKDLGQGFAHKLEIHLVTYE